MRLSTNIFKTILSVPDQLNLSLLLLMHITTLELLLMQIKHYLKKKQPPLLIVFYILSPHITYVPYLLESQNVSVWIYFTLFIGFLLFSFIKRNLIIAFAFTLLWLYFEYLLFITPSNLLFRNHLNILLRLHVVCYFENLLEMLLRSF